MARLATPRRAAFAVLLVAAVGLATACGGGDASSSSGSKLPDVRLEQLGKSGRGGETGSQAGTVNLGSLGTARPAVVNLWAVWCVPCRTEMPAINQVATTFQGLVDVYGINVGDTAAAAGEFVQQLGITFPQLLDPESSTQSALNVTGLPATVLVQDGKIVQRITGGVTAERLTAAIGQQFGITQS